MWFAVHVTMATHLPLGQSSTMHNSIVTWCVNVCACVCTHVNEAQYVLATTTMPQWINV